MYIGLDSRHTEKLQGIYARLNRARNSFYYASRGVGAFVRRYGHAASADTLYFTGIHRIGVQSAGTGQRLVLRGFDPAADRIDDVSGGVYLVAAGGEDSAGWSFSRLLEHWGRKHSSAAYVPYQTRSGHPPEYRFTSPVHLGEGTSFARFLRALAAGFVIYDPGSKVMAVGTSRPRVKARSQFRIGRNRLEHLYDQFTAEPIG
ncbi:MAG: hypothetical protein FJ191_10150 [Gammaproteobacteria bacterium]|nr:hypothetical protein [Gammaproteobacteria bacterium]